MESVASLSELTSLNLPAPVPYAVLTPGVPGPLPLCLMLMGGGGSRQNLVDCQPLFDRWWTDGALPPMVIATPSPGMGYYIEDRAENVRWESFLAEELVPHLQSAHNVAGARASTAITGISMGGYGALKTAFSHPGVFGVVAAMQPMLEPGLRDCDIGARNRIHHTSGGPARLIGSGRDPALFEANQPACIAKANAAAIREHNLAIYIEAGDHDFVNAHDGAEFLHRVLWDLDLSHEYRLTRGADHGGPTMHPRMKAMFEWTGAALKDPTAPDDEFLRTIRAQLKPLRDQAAQTDETTHRRFGVL